MGGNGILSLYNEAYAKYASGSHRVLAYEYDVNVKHLAAQIAEHYFDHDHTDYPRITLIGYSWGGQAMVNLARELWNYFVWTDTMVLCDPVKRYSKFNFFKYLNTHNKVINVVPSVMKVYWYWQNNKWPQGSRIKTHGFTQMNGRDLTNKGYEHLNIDESEQFINRVRSVLEAL